ncbi:hypothetical protein LPC08_18560 [Roseomonas sp. OT10]|uniref:hypothetical protein n=1 Tax=Roseomonas cutis TaxID=2897332 RepID=UPI001E42BA96|nr:hypothetical protein [Roseomonas sp. OT10]UFN47999.1 hypothetical protein LPC08_18560 [Roseomonas sp. OT10]
MRRLMPALALPLLLAACGGGEAGPAERTGRSLDRAAERTGAAVGRGARATGDALGRAGNWVGEKMDPAPEPAAPARAY